MSDNTDTWSIDAAKSLAAPACSVASSRCVAARNPVVSLATWMSPSPPAVVLVRTTRLAATLKDAVTPASAALMRSSTALSESEA